MQNDTAILITSFTGYPGDSNNEIKKLMEHTLCRNMFNAGHFVCLASHSPVALRTQIFCHRTIFDADNSWQIKGVPQRPNHGVAELTSIHNGLGVLKRMGFKYILKQCFDVCPVVDYHDMINCSRSLCQTLDKKLLTYENDTDVATLMFFAEIDFFEKTLSLDEIWRFNAAIERGWKDSIREKGLLKYVQGFNYDDWNRWIGLRPGEELHYSHFREDGNLIHPYPFANEDYKRI